MKGVALRDLRIESETHAVVDDVSLRIAGGELFALCGESGAGKTTAALALLGYVRPGLRHAGGTAQVVGIDPFGISARERRALRAETVGYVGQGAGGGLNPAFRVRRLLAETVRDRPRAERRGAVDAALRAAGLDPGAVLDRYPHQLSGGQQQRIAIAMALTGDPDILVLDEPTTGLDTSTQAQILDAIDDLRRARRRAVLLICHDLSLVAERADRIGVMRDGRLLEHGPTLEILRDPADPYTRELRDAAPDHLREREPSVARVVGRAATEERMAPLVDSTTEIADAGGRRGSPAIAVEDLRAIHRTRSGIVVAADGIGFSVERGTCLALVGESGSGKTTIARTLVGLHRPAAGRVLLDGVELPRAVRDRTRDQHHAIQLVFQDPQETLNPHQAVREALDRPLQLVGRLGGSTLAQRRSELLERVGLPEALMGRRPYELSGGERQRVAIARALALAPRVLVCDEVTTALDARTQARVVELLGHLRGDLGLALILITHDLGLAAELARDTLVLQDGRCREQGRTRALLRDPRDGYTRRLVDSAPSMSRALRDGR